MYAVAVLLPFLLVWVAAGSAEADYGGPVAEVEEQYLFPARRLANLATVRP